MTASAALASALGQTMAVLAESADATKLQLIGRGFDDDTARQIVNHARTYHGPTKATRKQATARERAAKNNHTLNTLDVIETQVRKLKNKDFAWAMRVELTGLAPRNTVLRTRGAELVDKYNTPGVANPEMRLSARDVPHSTLADMKVRGPAHLAQAALERAHDFAATHDLEPAEALLRLAATGESTTGPAVAPAVIIPIDDTVTGWEKHSLDEVQLAMTNGATMTGRDFVRSELTERGFALLVDPVKKAPLGLYGIAAEWDTTEEEPESTNKRFASTLQRLIQRLVTPVCARPGCGKGADCCQMHHIVPHSRGGPTALENMTMLCPFDNGRNDDDPARPARGRIDKIGGIDYLIPAFGGEPEINTHPAAKGGALRLFA